MRLSDYAVERAMRHLDYEGRDRSTDRRYVESQIELWRAGITHDEVAVDTAIRASTTTGEFAYRMEDLEEALKAEVRRLRRRLLCFLGLHAWASHSDHLHFANGHGVASVVSTPCLYCGKRRHAVTRGRSVRR